MSISSIFSKKNAKEPPQLEILAPAKGSPGEHGYDWAAALSKALLVFMLSYGAVGGFLSAYEMEYHKAVCMAGLLAFSLVMGFLYEVGNKAVTNTAMILIFLGYAYMAATRFWVLNSGAYTVINKMYEVARNYLRVTNGNEYSLQIQDTYRTVTAIALFVGAVLVILLTLRLQYKASLLRTFLLTFTLFLIPLYFERTPDRLTGFFLLAGYATIFMVQCSGGREHISGQIRRALPPAAVLAGAVILLSGILIPQSRYRLMVPKNARKAVTENAATDFAQFGLMALLQNHSAGGGVSGGKLSRNGMVMPAYKTDLRVRFTPYSMEPVYLKAFTGLDYRGERWTDLEETYPGEGSLLAEAEGRREKYEDTPDTQGRGVMEVMNVDASTEFEYRPYYAQEDPLFQMGNTASYLYYPPVGDVEIREETPEERYLNVPLTCLQAVENTCLEMGLQGTPEEIAEQISLYFSEHFTYTLRPGYYYGSMDYISYFLAQNKKGYCSHFASAATMLFRYMGIPARYVEGYAFSYTDVVLDGELQEADYEQYYTGCSPLGRTALVELEVTDDQAHAWVEIYIEGKGWVVVDPTPAASDEEETAAFWDAIGLGQTSGDGTGPAGDGLGAYLENALAGSRSLLVALLAVAGILFLYRKIRQRRREAALPGVERVKLEYRRLMAGLSGKDPEFAGLTTPAQELARIREYYAPELPEEFTQELYRVLFAPAPRGDCEALRRELVALRRRLAWKRRVPAGKEGGKP